MSNKPLSGVKVVELATFIAAATSGRFLADLGADVIKIEINTRFKSDFNVEVYDNIGGLLKTLKKSESDTFFEVDLSKFPAGFYFIRIYNKNRYYQTKVIKK